MCDFEETLNGVLGVGGRLCSRIVYVTEGFLLCSMYMYGVYTHEQSPLASTFIAKRDLDPRKLVAIGRVQCQDVKMLKSKGNLPTIYAKQTCGVP